MGESSASDGGRDRNKRFWSQEENKALIDALCELASDSHWKCENGFRNGYMTKLEELIGKAIPGCGLKSIPHIDSRLKTLVGKFRAITQMLGTSGFKWDDDKHMISLEKSVYDEYCKAHPNYKNLYGIPFPCLNEMMGIYGKDYATGKSAEGFAEAVENIEKKALVLLTLDSSDDDLDGSSSFAPSLKKARKDKTVKKRSKKGVVSARGGSSSSEFGALTTLVENMNVQLTAMANAMNRANDREPAVAEKDDKVLDDLLSLDSLSEDEALNAAELLLAQPHELKLFFKCSGGLKTRYVKGLLRERGGNA